MLDIDTKLFRSFLAVAAERSFSAAGEVLACSQGTMSLRIRTLEEQLGTYLFDRGHRNVRLTSAGRDLLPSARALVDMHDRMVDRSKGGATSGFVRLGVAEGHGFALVHKLLKHLPEVCPALELSVVSRPTWRLGQMIDARTLDLAIVTLLEGDPTVGQLCRSRLHWVASPDFMIDGRQPIPVAFQDECRFRAPGLAALERCEIAYREALSSPDEHVVLAAVSAGSAITILAEGTVPEWLKIISPPSPLPTLGRTRIQLLENPGRQSEAIQAVKREIIAAYLSD